MTAVNFSANGTRWRAMPITTEQLGAVHPVTLPGPGVLFSSADGEMRFLALDASSVPASDALLDKTNDELGALVRSATPLS
jgi:hypothetical protein